MDEEVQLGVSLATRKMKAALSSQGVHLLDYKTWVDEGPIALRALLVFGGLAMVITGGFGIISGVVNPLHGVVQAYILLFGLVFVILEAKEVPYCYLDKLKEKMMPYLEEQARFLTTLQGKGGFMFFCGTLLVSQFPDFIDFLLGIYMLCLSVLFGMISKNTLSKLRKFKDHVTDEATIEKLFKKYDNDNSQALDSDEFATFCKHELGADGLKHEELTAAMIAIDYDNSGTIDLKEFLRFWKELNEEPKFAKLF